MNDKLRILVTGGAGFIGSHLCERLLLSNHTVYCLDNFNDFYDPGIKRRNIAKCISLNNDRTGNCFDKFKLLETDIRDVSSLKGVFTSTKFDLVIHLAAMAGVRPSIENPSLYYDVNVIGTLNLLEKCCQFDVKRFIFASSSSVYGNNKKVPFSEEDNVDNPISPYASTKKAGELLCHHYYHLHQMSITCLRFFTVYGPRQRPDLAIHKFTKMMLMGEPIPVFGDGSTRRDYTYIDDIVDGIEKAVEYTCNDVRYEIFNLGESKTISLMNMIQTLEDSLDMRTETLYLPEQPGDVKQTYASLNKSSKLLGYEPKYDFNQGVEIFVKWFKEQSTSI